MKKLGLLVMPLMALSLLASCGNKSNLQIAYQNISNEGKAYVDVVKQKGFKEILKEGETWQYVWDSALERPDDFLKENVKAEIAKIEDKNVTDNFKKFGDDIVVYRDPFETYYFQLNENYERVIFYIHGGAYFNSIQSSHIKTGYKLAKLFNAKVYMPVYPLVPDYFYLVCYQFLDELYAKIVELDNDKEIIFAGDSAGGGLVLAYSQYLKKEKPNLRLPSARICFSPWCDVTLTNPDAINKEDKDIFLSLFGLRKLGEAWSYYYTSPYDYRISPLYGNLDDKIDTIIFNGTEEIFLADVKKTCNKLSKNGCRTKLVIGNGLFHIYPVYDLPESEEALQIAYDFVVNKK